jgi:hypothetical protein
MKYFAAGTVVRTQKEFSSNPDPIIIRNHFHFEIKCNLSETDDNSRAIDSAVIQKLISLEKWDVMDNKSNYSLQITAFQPLF